MALTKLLFVRHASVDYTGVPEEDLIVNLSSIGVTQSEELCKKLSSILKSPIASIYSSDLPRAMATILPFANQAGIVVKEDSRLREHDYKGDPKIFHEEVRSDPLFHHVGGETLQDSRNRFLEAVASIVKDNSGQCSIVSTHGTVFTEFMKANFDKTDDFYFQLSNPDIYYVLFDDHKACFYSRLHPLLPTQTI